MVLHRSLFIGGYLAEAGGICAIAYSMVIFLPFAKVGVCEIRVIGVERAEGLVALFFRLALGLAVASFHSNRYNKDYIGKAKNE